MDFARIPMAFVRIRMIFEDSYGSCVGSYGFCEDSYGFCTVSYGCCKDSYGFCACPRGDSSLDLVTPRPHPVPGGVWFVVCGSGLPAGPGLGFVVCALTFLV